MTGNRGSSDEVRGLSLLDNGLDQRQRIRREGELGLVDAVFLPLVSATESSLTGLLGERLHSVYLYGSVPRGTAVPGRSDLDVSVVLHEEPTDDERTAIARLAVDLDNTDVVDDVGITVDSRPAFLSPAQRYDGAFHVSCLCTPLWGPDLATELPDQHPCIELAKSIPSGTPDALVRLAADLDDPATPRLDYTRQRIGRRIARLAFTCVLSRWPGWTSDPTVLEQVVSAYYPDHTDEIRTCIRLGWGRLAGQPPVGTSHQSDARRMIDGPAAWWISEHRRVTAGGPSPRT